MSIINLNNYEAFLLDHFEGNLSITETEELKTFVLLHPELNIDLQNSDLPYFTKEEISLDFKSDLLKTEENLPAEEFINYIEGNLPEKEKNSFEKKLISDKELLAELEMFRKTISAADENIIFEEKNLLLKTEDELALNCTPLLYVEGLLAGVEKEQFEKEINSDPKLSAELQLYKMTKLVADVAVIYPGKDELKKEPKVFVLFSTRNVMGLAAAVLLITGLIVLFNFYNSKPVVNEEIAKKAVEKSVQPITDKIIVDSVMPKINIPEVKQNLAAKVKDAKKSDQFLQKKIKFDSLAENNSARNLAVEKNEKEINIQEMKNQNDSAIVAVNPDKNPGKNETVNESKKTVLLAVQEDDEETISDAPKRNRFWKRAVRVAQQVNGLGIKAVNGDEKTNERYMLSFSAFSVEKK